MRAEGVKKSLASTARSHFCFVLFWAMRGRYIYTYLAPGVQPTRVARSPNHSHAHTSFLEVVCSAGWSTNRNLSRNQTSTVALLR